ncbi:MAG TPA: twin-arginine translocase TatA/TatE family subunit [Methylomirabilota bacterium]|nr:twin-arginine translocase TatA/TatE family subunit [Methylomirabilota bacterium]
MNTSFFALGLGWPEIIGILVIVLVLFGAKKLPELARGLGQGIKEFKKATKDVQEDLHRAIDEDDHRPTPTLPRATDTVAKTDDVKPVTQSGPPHA